MLKNIIILSGGCSFDPAYFKKQIRTMKNSLIVCCDGGVRHLRHSSIKPDVIIGDMDSIDSARLANYARQKIKIIKFPENKDYSDTELALDYALSLKPERIIIWCALGGRIDHTLANIFLLLKGHKKGIQTFIMDEYCDIFILDKKHSFIHETGKTISLLALTPKVTGITLSGFVYHLKKDTLKTCESRGISNIIRKTRAMIRVEKGKLLVIKYRKKGFFPEVL